MMIAVGLAAVCGPVGVRLPQAPLPGLIQRFVLAGQRAAFALTPLPRGVPHRPAHGLPALRLALSFALKAAGTGSPLRGALFMIAFWLGSVPALVLVGAGVQTLARRFRAARAAGHGDGDRPAWAFSRSPFGRKGPCWPLCLARAQADAASVQAGRRAGQNRAAMLPETCRGGRESAVAGLVPGDSCEANRSGVD